MLTPLPSKRVGHRLPSTLSQWAKTLHQFKVKDIQNKISPLYSLTNIKKLSALFLLFYFPINQHIQSTYCRLGSLLQCRVSEHLMDTPPSHRGGRQTHSSVKWTHWIPFLDQELAEVSHFQSSVFGCKYWADSHTLGNQHLLLGQLYYQSLYQEWPIHWKKKKTC